MMRDIIDEVLRSVVKASQAKFGERLVGIIHYGSSVHQVKSVSDIDLIFVFTGDQKPKISEFDFLDQLAEPEFQRMSRQGFQYQLSINPLLLKELDPTHSFYFDLVDRSQILIDRNDQLKSFLQEVQLYIREKGYERIRHGSRWYWRLATPKK